VTPMLAELDRGPMVLDAGMGTRLRDRGLNLAVDDPAPWSLDRPADILEIHRRDIDAGSRALLTNTFGADRVGLSLSKSVRRGDVEAINRAGVRLARQIAGDSRFVLGDIGLTAGTEPGAAGEQAAILVDAGVDALILETFLFDNAIAAVKELRASASTSAAPLIVSLWRWPEAVEDAARRLADAGADVIGINCRPPMHDALAIVRRLAGAVACPLLVKPGVAPGDPEEDSTPAAFAVAVPVLVAHNVRMIGGCCGTTEAHIAALAAACANHGKPENPL